MSGSGGTAAAGGAALQQRRAGQRGGEARVMHRQAASTQVWLVPHAGSALAARLQVQAAQPKQRGLQGTGHCVPRAPCNAGSCGPPVSHGQVGHSARWRELQRKRTDGARLLDLVHQDLHGILRADSRVVVPLHSCRLGRRICSTAASRAVVVRTAWDRIECLWGGMNISSC